MDSSVQTPMIKDRHTPTRSQSEMLRPWLLYFLQAIRQGSTPSKPPPYPDDWDQFVNTLAFHQLTPLLYWALQAQPIALQPPTAIMQQMRTQYLQMTAHSLQRTHELHKILTALNTVGIQPTLYKGSALAYTVYPSPVCRTMSDLDLWIDAEEIATAQAVIEDLGYRSKARAKRPDALQQQFDGEIPLVGPGNHNGLIELHWGVFAGQWLHRVAAIDRSAVRQRCITTELLGLPIHLLANEDAVIQVAVHLGINHQLSHYPLRSLLDIALLDQQKIDWAVVVERARQWRLTTVMSIVLDLLLSVFGSAALSPGLTTAAATLRDITRWQPLAQQWRRPEIVFSRTKLSAHHGRYFYLLCMVDRPVDVLYLLMRTIWPESEWLTARYGCASGPVRLRHIKSALQGAI